MERTAKMTSEVVIPLSGRVLIRKDEDKKETKGGLILPDTAKVPVITGRIVEISAMVENDEELPIRKYDKVLVNPSRGIPVDFDGDNKLYVIPVEDVVAVFRKEAPNND